MTDESKAPVYQQPDTSLLGDEHVRVYRATGGTQGYTWNGATILLLTTTGRGFGRAEDHPDHLQPGWRQLLHHRLQGRFADTPQMVSKHSR